MCVLIQQSVLTSVSLWFQRLSPSVALTSGRAREVQFRTRCDCYSPAGPLMLTYFRTSQYARGPRNYQRLSAGSISIPRKRVQYSILSPKSTLLFPLFSMCSGNIIQYTYILLEINSSHDVAIVSMKCNVCSGIPSFLFAGWRPDH